MGIQANEEWRRDPIRQEKSKKLCRAYVSYYTKLLSQLEEAQLIVTKISHAGGREQTPSRYGYNEYMSFRTDIQTCKRKISYYSNPSETLISNMAAFGEGSK